uniref:tRNA N6-adenosine threonylcarbamoyltransferase, mitochondrial isoform X2 n=1 Tax=Myxine glutinosa TaxID=7769 RepID=UPI00358EF6D8
MTLRFLRCGRCYEFAPCIPWFRGPNSVCPLARRHFVSKPRSHTGVVVLKSKLPHHWTSSLSMIKSKCISRFTSSVTFSPPSCTIRRRHCTAPHTMRPLLGIETSCDETGAAVVDATNGVVLGEALYSQLSTHTQMGGIHYEMAQRLHRENVARVVDEAMRAAGVSVEDLTAVATTVQPGLPFSLAVGLEFTVGLLNGCPKPFIPIHHMEAHALTVRLQHPVPFPFLVLLLSGGHCLLAVARGPGDFLRLGETLDSAPGCVLDRMARRLALLQLPECAGMSGGQALEHVALKGDCDGMNLPEPLIRMRDCNFSFSGLLSSVCRIIERKEKEEGKNPGDVLSCASDIASAAQHSVGLHIAKRTHRAMMFALRYCLVPRNPTLVVSGGVASNAYIRAILQAVASDANFTLLCPPARLCTDNGVMIAWNGVERFRANVGVLPSAEGIRFEPRAPLGVDISARVKAESIPNIRRKFKHLSMRE